MSSPSRMLYVEDEEDDVFFMRTALKRLGLADRFHAVGDGEQAIDYLAGKGPFADRERAPLPSLLVLDLNLPIRSGFEVLEWLRNQPEFATLTVVIFSSSGRPEDRRRAQQLGATEYLLKPTSGVEFFEIASQLTRAWGERAHRQVDGAEVRQPSG